MRNARAGFLPASALLVLLLPACALFGYDDADGDVTAEATPPNLVITNGTDRPVWTFVVGVRMAALIDWVQNVQGEGLAPGAEERVPYDELLRAEGDEQVIVYWWHAVLEDGERVPGELHSFVVEL